MRALGDLLVVSDHDDLRREIVEQYRISARSRGLVDNDYVEDNLFGNDGLGDPVQRYDPGRNRIAALR